jgi:HEAT repeat protein
MLLCGSLNAAAAQLAPDRPRSVVAFQQASADVKRNTLNDLGALRFSPPPSDVGEIIAAGLADHDADVRLCAVYAAAGRAGAVRFEPSSDNLTRDRAERSFLGRLRPAVMHALNDENARIRKGAVVALVNLEYERGRPTNDIALKPDLANELRLHLASETSPAVRAEIVKTFALTSLESAMRDDVLIRAMADRDEEVVHFAVLGLGRSTPSDALDRLVSLVSHPDRSVRLQVGQALQAYGVAAQPYIGTLLTASAAERDETVKKALEAAIARIQRAR